MHVWTCIRCQIIECRKNSSVGLLIWYLSSLQYQSEFLCIWARFMDAVKHIHWPHSVRVSPPRSLLPQATVLKDRLKIINNLSNSTVHYQMTMGYNLLGWLELLQRNYNNAARWLGKSGILRVDYKKYITTLEAENYALINLSMVCKHNFNGKW